MQPYKRKKSPPYFAAIIIAACSIAALIYYFGVFGGASDRAKKAESGAARGADMVNDAAALSEATVAEAAVDLKPSQLDAIKIEAVATHSFRMEKETVGSVAYHEKDIPPDSAPAPQKAVKLVVANVPESDSPLIHAGQSVEVRAKAYPGRVFTGKVSVVGVTVYDSGGNPAIDPATHRIAVRCEVADPQNALYPGMLAAVAIQVEKPVESAAIPANGVIRKGDGTMTAWVTKDRKRFEERTVKVGMEQNGYDQILEGLKPGELVATDGAIFISNILYAPPSD